MALTTKRVGFAASAERRSKVTSDVGVAAIVLFTVAAGPACWLGGWADFVNAFNSNASDSLRVTDLRVLAIASSPSVFVVDPRVIYSDESEIDVLEPITLTVRADIVDPRGGRARVGFWMCAAEEAWEPSVAAQSSAYASAGLGANVVVTDTLTVLERCKSYRRDDTSPVPIDDEVRALMWPHERVVTFAPTPADPFGPPTENGLLEQRFTLTPRVQRALANLIPGALRDFNGGKLVIVIDVVGAVDRDTPESETAFLSIDFRVDIDSPFMPPDERTRIVDELGGPPPCDPALLASCTNDRSPFCGNGLLDIGEGETCEPTAVWSFCPPRGTEEECFGFRECDRCQGLDHACVDLFHCRAPLRVDAEAALPVLFAHDVETVERFSDAGDFIEGGHVRLSSAPLDGDIVVDAPATGRLHLSANLEPAAVVLTQRERPAWQERDDENAETAPPEFYDDDAQAYVPLRFKRLLTTQTAPCLILYAAPRGPALNDVDESGNQVLHRPDCTRPTGPNGEDYIVELPTRQSDDGHRVLAYAFSDTRGAWRFGRITFRAP